jgi:aminoglycoside 6'-N-acetyltransferase I
MDNFKVVKMERQMIDECVDLFINTFSKEPWNDEYESRNQVVTFFENHMRNTYFCGYVGLLNDKIVALSVGMQKPWIKGMEYYIDEFCVSYELQGKGIGSSFLVEIEKDINQAGMNAIILNTEKDFPSEKFYVRNGFEVLSKLIVLAK